MASIKQISIIITIVAVLSTTLMAPAVAAISEEQTNAVVQNCSNIKQSLVKLQHSDSRTRTYLGSSYEAISTRFITPLNLRLVKNNLPITELFKIQNDFSAAQSSFRNKYVDYMRELEGLIATDCSTHPADFYQKLTAVRTKREDLRKVTKTLSELADQQYQSVSNLEKSLRDE